MKIHAIGLGARLITHEIGAVFSRAQTTFQNPSIYRNIVDVLNGS